MLGWFSKVFWGFNIKRLKYLITVGGFQSFWAVPANEIEGKILHYNNLTSCNPCSRILANQEIIHAINECSNYENVEIMCGKTRKEKRKFQIRP